MTTAAIFGTNNVLDSSVPLEHSPVPVKSFHQLEKTQEIKITGVGDLRAIAVSKTGSVWWVGGTQGKIAKSVNQASFWNVYAPSDDTRLDFRALCALDDNTICAMTAGMSQESLAKIYRTTDGGEHWSSVFSPTETNIFFNSMQFWDDQNGLLLCDPVNGHFAFFHTIDGGKTWNKLTPTNMPPALEGEAAFAASNSCLAVYGQSHVWFCTGKGAYARVFYSQDRGRNWKVFETPMALNSPSSGLFSLAFKNTKCGIAVGGDYNLEIASPKKNIYFTFDGGKTWNPSDKETALCGHYLSCAQWDAKGTTAYVVDRTAITYNSLVIDNGYGLAVGPEGKCMIFHTR